MTATTVSGRVVQLLGILLASAEQDRLRVYHHGMFYPEDVEVMADGAEYCLGEIAKELGVDPAELTAAVDDVMDDWLVENPWANEEVG